MIIPMILSILVVYFVIQAIRNSMQFDYQTWQLGGSNNTQISTGHGVSISSRNGIVAIKGEVKKLIVNGKLLIL
jgi:hypothetical protein